MEPFKLAPIVVAKPWGGRRLAELGKTADTQPIGESWEVADLSPRVAPHVDDPTSRVASGPWTGWALGAIAGRARDELMGPVPLTDDGRFPLLVKLLDAREHLSVQVHPDEAYVVLHDAARLKTESWYVMEADPGSKLFLDVTGGSEDQIRRALRGSSIIGHLREVSAQIGGFHHVPAGMIHALGAGVMVAEFQTPSDTTFRLYDWSEEFGREPRDLHTAEALEAVVVHHPDRMDLEPMDSQGSRQLVTTPYYWLREHRGNAQIELGTEPGPRIAMCVAGSVAIGDITLENGETAIVPASALEKDIAVSGTLLEAGIPV